MSLKKEIGIHIDAIDDCQNTISKKHNELNSNKKSILDLKNEVEIVDKNLIKNHKRINETEQQNSN